MAGWGKGASTVRMPSLDKELRIDSGSVPAGSKNSRLYSLYTDLPDPFSSCLAWTCIRDWLVDQSCHHWLYTYQELVIHGLDHNLLRSVLTHVKPQLELLLTLDLIRLTNEWRVQALEPVAVVSQATAGEHVLGLLTGTVKDDQVMIGIHDCGTNDDISLELSHVPGAGWLFIDHFLAIDKLLSPGRGRGEGIWAVRISSRSKSSSSRLVKQGQSLIISILSMSFIVKVSWTNVSSITYVIL